MEHRQMEAGDTPQAKLAWEPMKLDYRGNVAEIIQIGGGKLTRTAGDPGEPRKPRGCEHKLDYRESSRLRW